VSGKPGSDANKIAKERDLEMAKSVETVLRSLEHYSNVRACRVLRACLVILGGDDGCSETETRRMLRDLGNSMRKKGNT